MVKFNPVRIKNCMGFETISYYSKYELTTDEYDKLYNLFTIYGKLKEFNFIKKLVKIESTEFDLSMVVPSNKFTIIFKKGNRNLFEEKLIEIFTN